MDGDTMLSSPWSDTSSLPRFARLRGNIQTDVLIVGGGLAGILCAYRLTQAGVSCVVAEARRICSGVTKNTTAKITSQHGLLYDSLIRRFGLARARMYLRANEAALDAYRALCRDIDCDFEERDAFVYTLDDRGKLERELNALVRIGFAAELVDSLPLPFAVSGAIRFARQAQFHPLKFVSAIAPGLPIYEHTPVRELIKTTAVTDGGRISADRIIIATHFPILNKHGGYFLKMHQSRAYVLALENAPSVRGMYVDEADDGLSFRDYDDLLLLGGGGHRTGKHGGAWRPLEECAKRWYPAARERFRYATQDCMTLDGVPYIGPYAAGTEDLYVATGFNKWGMSSAMVSAMILSDMMQGKRNPYAPVFDPSRSILRPQLAINAFEAVTSLLTISPKRCPHMGCALHWNENERSWDCSCHGSRFQENGRLLNNPATGDLPGER